MPPKKFEPHPLYLPGFLWSLRPSSTLSSFNLDQVSTSFSSPFFNLHRIFTSSISLRLHSSLSLHIFLSSFNPHQISTSSSSLLLQSSSSLHFLPPSIPIPVSSFEKKRAATRLSPMILTLPHLSLRIITGIN
ncbi:hypothetical protein CEXT_791721 [Caerostris extrusa]|uniref:Uncharacterized protein n=1 Tax=Caerostris extrusa TaxID=172846 RepID=A0AAV4V8N2_CAEEX|nr:hypothetical protein CEXT_791721 [Caerostris extrusa]